ncbi:hypothetical protein IEC338SC_2677 [Acinetobacter pittii]|uniref:Uncharacterized protein n=1 Tax=Acinetobacter pittii TaxID=48296 RepID=A0AB33BAX4_ACIPI|nr:hypothetical protein IEC338SC_2677 [Acinetobacter pittii]
MFMFLLAGRITAQKSPAKYRLLAGLFISLLSKNKLSYKLLKSNKNLFTAVNITVIQDDY